MPTAARGAGGKGDRGAKGGENGSKGSEGGKKGLKRGWGGGAVQEDGPPTRLLHLGSSPPAEVKGTEK